MRWRHLARTLVLRRDPRQIVTGTPSTRVAALVSATGAVRQGEVVWLRGANGAGKSTLVAVLAGLMAADAGQVQRGGGRLAWLATERLGLVPRATVLQHLVWHRDERQTDVPQIPTVAKFFGLEALQRRRTRELSRGEQVRLALACAALAGCHAWCLDEVLAALDDDMLLQFLGFLRQRGDRALLVGHDARLGALCDRVVQIAAGELPGSALPSNPPPPQPPPRPALARALARALAGGPMVTLRRLLTLAIATAVPLQVAAGRPEVAAGLWCGLLGLGVQTLPAAEATAQFFGLLRVGADDVLRAQGVRAHVLVAAAAGSGFLRGVAWTLPLLALAAIAAPGWGSAGLGLLVAGAAATVGLSLLSLSLAVLVRNAAPLTWLVHGLTLVVGPIAASRAVGPAWLTAVGALMPASLVANGLRRTLDLPAHPATGAGWAAVAWLAVGVLALRTALIRYQRDGALGLRA